jgi:PAP2 superfamily protein
MLILTVYFKYMEIRVFHYHRADILKKKSFLRAIDILNLVYVAFVALLILIFHNNLENWKYFFLIHVGLFLGLLAFFRVTAFSKNKFLRILRDIYAPLIIIYYYEETDHLNHIIFPYFFDPFFARVEELIFGCQPAFEFLKHFPHPLFSEYMHFSYFSYYLLIPALGLPLLFTRRQKDYDSFIFSCILNMTFCYTFYIFIPCAGPWHYFADLSARWQFPGYLFTSTMELILKYGEIANGAFPSSHVAMATVILLCTWKYLRKLFWYMLPVVISLYASTVYTQAHYVIDVPAGCLVGVFFYLISDRVKMWLEHKFKLRITDECLDTGNEKNNN